MTAVLLRPVVTALVAGALALGSFLVVLGIGTGSATAEVGQVAARSDCSAAQQDLTDATAAVASDRRLVKRWTRRLRRADTAAQERRYRRKLRQARRSLRLQVEWRDDAQRTYDDCLAGTPSPTSPAPTTTSTTPAPTSPAPTTTTTSPPPSCLPELPLCLP